MNCFKFSLYTITLSYYGIGLCLEIIAYFEIEPANNPTGGTVEKGCLAGSK